MQLPKLRNRSISGKVMPPLAHQQLFGKQIFSCFFVAACVLIYINFDLEFVCFLCCCFSLSAFHP